MKVENKKEVKQSRKKSVNLNFLWILIGLILPPVGLVLFLMWKKNNKEQAKKVGVASLVSACIWLFVGLSFLIDASGENEVSKDIQEWQEYTFSNKTSVTVIALSYCSHCADYKPVITKIAEEKNIKLYWYEADEMNGADLNALSSAYNISYDGRSPFTMVTKAGKLLGETVGYMDRNDTLSFLKGIGAIKN